MKIAIIGRPNVGKSTLFNRLLRRRVAIVDSKSGVTRDRLHGEVEWDGRKFIVIDSGGVEFGAKESLQQKIVSQIEVAIAEADLVIFLTDVKQGVVPVDKEIGRLLRQREKKVLVAVNKVDNQNLQSSVYSFSELGWDTVVGISAAHGLGIDSLLNKIIKEMPEGEITAPEPLGIKVAVIGKPNVGKSTFINAVLNEQRVIVDEKPGTTRDAVDIKFIRKGLPWILIDTAGMRKKRKVKQPLEYYSVRRSFVSINRADIVILMIDGWEGLYRQDVQLVDHIMAKAKPCVLAVNKWDLVEKVSQREYSQRLESRLAEYWFIPPIFISSLKKTKIEQLLDKIEDLSAQSREKIATPLLNKIIKGMEIIKHTKVYYGTQTKINPLTFLLFVNKTPSPNVGNYIISQIRKAFNLEVPIRLRYRVRKWKE